MVPGILEKLTDDELKREAKSETKSDIVSAIIKSSKNLASRVPNQEELIRTLEGFRLTMILRQLQISSFNGKMNALNEINKVISSVTYYPNRHHEEDEYLTPERMAVSKNKHSHLLFYNSLRFFFLEMDKRKQSFRNSFKRLVASASIRREVRKNT